jgi:hypothetical protein
MGTLTDLVTRYDLLADGDLGMWLRGRHTAAHHERVHRQMSALARDFEIAAWVRLGHKEDFAAGLVDEHVLVWGDDLETAAAEEMVETGIGFTELVDVLLYCRKWFVPELMLRIHMELGPLE